MGGEALARLVDLQIQAQIGIADTKGAAKALARFWYPECVCGRSRPECGGSCHAPDGGAGSTGDE